MTDVNEATQGDLPYVEDLYGEEAFPNFLPEEVERDEEDGTPYRFITIGFTEQKRPGGPFGNLAVSRRYK